MGAYFGGVAEWSKAAVLKLVKPGTTEPAETSAETASCAKLSTADKVPESDKSTRSITLENVGGTLRDDSICRALARALARALDLAVERGDLELVERIVSQLEARRGDVRADRR